MAQTSLAQTSLAQTTTGGFFIMSISFEGKVALITGGAQGLGRCHALELARRGAKIMLNDLGGSADGRADGSPSAAGTSAAAQAVVSEIVQMGGEAQANGASVTDDDGVAQMVEETKKAFGRIDILINNAGILRDKTFAKVTMEDFEAVVDVHMWGTVKVTKAVWPHMREQGFGRILVTTSSSGIYGNFGQTNYGTAKTAVVGLMNTLKLEGEKYNIHINALAPVAATRMTSEIMSEEIIDAMRPELVTPGVIFLVSEDAPNGIILSAAGGGFAVAKMMESRGVFLGKNPTPEEVAARWGEISDMSQATALANGGEQIGKFFQMTSG